MTAGVGRGIAGFAVKVMVALGSYSDHGWCQQARTPPVLCHADVEGEEGGRDGRSSTPQTAGSRSTIFEQQTIHSFMSVPLRNGSENEARCAITAGEEGEDTIKISTHVT